MKIIFTTIVMSLVMLSCTKIEKEDTQQNEHYSVNLVVNNYNNTSGVENLDVSSLNAFLVKNGVLSGVYHNLAVSNNKFILPSDYFQGSDVALYFIANTESVKAGIKQYKPESQATYSSTDIMQDMMFLTDKKILFPKIPLGGKVDFAEIADNTTINVEMRYAMARVDIKIDDSNIEIDSVSFENLSTGGYLVEQPTPFTGYVGELFDYTQSFISPITASQTIGYINSQYNNSNLKVKIFGRFNGLKVELSSYLPKDIKRNTIYTIRLAKLGTTLTASITIADWNDGGTTEATPDLDAKILIDPSRSAFDTEVSYSASCDTLFVPSNRNSDIVLALDAQYELEATIGGNMSDISVETESGFNRFRIKVNGQSPGSGAYYSYVMFRNKFFENSYGERVVLCVAPNRDYLIADINTLSSISAIDAIGGLATVSQYGSNDITIAANKIRVGSDLFAIIQTIEDVSQIESEYRAIKLSLSGNSLILKSVANTTELAQSATVIIKGVTMEGKKTAALVSITIPAIEKDEMDTFNSLCVEMGGNVWMQFNTTGVFATDMQRAKQIAGLPTGITANNIKANFALFGKFAEYYNTVPVCPTGYRLPTQQEYCNLLGVANTSSLSSLNGISSGSMTTTGGMTLSYSLFSNVGLGQALVTISKGDKVMYLTNGRFATNPSRGFFEFWYSGAFSAGTAQTNTYNWATRCVKNTSYKGLN